MGKLNEKICVITGGSSGIGLGVARQFLVENAKHVFIISHSKESLDQALLDLHHSNVTAIQCDLAKSNQINEMFQTIKDKTESIDVLFVNAGILVDGLLGSIDEQMFDEVFDINVKGILFSVDRLLPLMVRGGSIIINSSVRCCKASSNRSIYSATKAAIRSFARSWSIDLQDRQIRVNSICPGAIQTSISQLSNRTIPLGNLASQSVLNRRGTIEEVAQSVVFLASDQSLFINGIELFIDAAFAQI